MNAISNEIEYNAIKERVEELLKVVTNETEETDKNFIELNILSELMENYENTYYSVSIPSLVDVLKLRMYEMGLSQKALAKMLGISASRVNDYMSGKSEPTLPIARKIKTNLNIDADIILGI